MKLEISTNGYLLKRWVSYPIFVAGILAWFWVFLESDRSVLAFLFSCFSSAVVIFTGAFILVGLFGDIVAKHIPPKVIDAELKDVDSSSGSGRKIE